MKRRDSLKKIILGAVIPCISSEVFAGSGYGFWPYAKGVVFKSDWHNWPDMKWVGPDYWGNRLQDWKIDKGRAICDVTGADRNLHLLPIQKPEQNIGFTTSVRIEILNDTILGLENGCIGIRLGAKGPFDDYRSAAVFGKGLDIGLTPSGNLVIGESVIKSGLETLPKEFGLVLEAVPKSDGCLLKISVTNTTTDALLFQHETIQLPSNKLTGNFALLAHCPGENKNSEENTASVAFSDWSIASEELHFEKDHFFGPICFAQYTLNKGKLKLTAQLAPIETIAGHSVSFQIKEKGQWKDLRSTNIQHAGRAVNFTFEDWNSDRDIPYRVVAKVPLKNRTEDYYYKGTIAKEPLKKDEIKAAVFSCNFHYGFPDADIPLNVSKLDADIILFLGDQFYEGTGGFGVQFKGSFDKTCLDYLRKWYMFGWSYRDLFRHKPCAIIPDDHDVYHGNVWGEEGKKADTSGGYGASAQDSGGYKMPAKWVNMVQFTQTSHLPDPYDPTPVKQGIGVYYTHWNYGGISFAILEDRKFKSAPKNILPKEAQVNNGWILNEAFDIKKYKDLPANLLGDRQERFLEEWVQDWSKEACMKVVLSQTNFATVATLPKEAKTGAVIPGLYIPQKGEYIEGDRPTVDMDSNGWPSKKRDEAVGIIRKAFAFHIAGDQHLGSFIQYGLEEHGDSGHAFAGPALNNIWPRRFWPSVDSSLHTYENPAYVGEHVDGFGNKMTVKAVANPHSTNKKPKIIHDRAVGYGLVTFNKKTRTIKTDCWPRFVDPTEPGTQYPGWPISIGQEHNYARKAQAWLPELKVIGNHRPVVTIFDENKDLVHALRMATSSYLPKVFKPGAYTVVVQVPETEYYKKITNVKAKVKQRKSIQLNLEE
ncbi:alkaline phosphatase D family protein [Spongiimicrobium sp. 3-5]|uniref:alkaline phosphatase D family protein n=1 Tax=Spongiimicrobium sp. 3-5 TaxID=3332596 RepID=UPI00397F0CA3